MIPTIPTKPLMDLFLTTRGYMCHRCLNVKKCCELNPSRQVEVMRYCMCELEVLTPDDESYPVEIPEV